MPSDSSTSTSTSGIFGAWWPLALSWLLMGIELPMISSVVARLPDQTVQLAAFGGVVFPLALLVEAPVIMMLAASTALSTNADAYRTLKRFMGVTALAMTLLHFAFAFTPLYDVVLVPLLDMPREVVEPARTGFQLMLPWTWAIADRRFHQGVLIRFGQRSAVAVGTGVRLITTLSVLAVGWMIQAEGALLAASALSISTLCEAVYARIRVAPILRGALIHTPINDVVVRGRALLRFYVPLAMTPLLVLAMQPIGAAGIDRMPNAVTSLAIWAPLSGLVFFCRSPGVAYNEVVIGHSTRPEARKALRRFAWRTGLIASGILGLLSIPACSRIWFGEIIGLHPDLVALGERNIWIALPIPLLTFLQSYYQGVIVNAHRTRYITESVGVYALVTCMVIVIGVMSQPAHGITVVMIATMLGNLIQTVWLWQRCSRQGLELSDPDASVPEK
ncbi:MAG: hypothetical protein VX641_02810 [Planctomycetota bacterium]|nr:hypothetical protein [Planctomycetota bacterium]